MRKLGLRTVKKLPTATERVIKTAQLQDSRSIYPIHYYELRASNVSVRP